MNYAPGVDEKDRDSLSDCTAEVSEFQSDKYLIFSVSGQEYAMDAAIIVEVIHYVDVTEVPNTFSYVRGVLSLRGTVIPIIDFMEYIGLTATTVKVNTRILIVNFNDMLVGMLVDSTSGVVSISPESFRPVPEFIGKENLRFYRAAMDYNSRLILLIETSMEKT
ncbi:MAG: purine-binding chemotaxis protein CheW [Nitrospirae bacterium]|nr:purine-binding chemotaxis protein CheW [Nitrospirota bacterium]